jgi:diadenosine tetraphosphate (Ap4A) HIT family hydrolase
MKFELLDTFKKKDQIIDLKLCKVLMEDKEYPWILLIPTRANITQINQLSEGDSIQLIKEINFSSNIMEKLFETDRLNIAAIGNKTPQLHIHIIARKKNDPLWPKTIWGQPMKNLEISEKIKRLNLLKNEFSKSWLKNF